MKSASPALAAHLAGEVTTLATCWRLERADGWVRGFTDHDRELVVDGLTYVASTGFLPSAIKTASDLSVDNLDVDGFLDDAALKAEDLIAGLFDLTPAEIARLHGPIGLDLGGKSPAEIAVAIVAEIVAVKNGVALVQKKEGSALPESSAASGSVCGVRS